ncbi:unnamed protein product [Caenorhabditis brenneri]
MSYLFTFTWFFALLCLFPPTYSYPADIFCSLCVDLFESAIETDSEDLLKFLEEKTTELCSAFPLPIDVTRQCFDYLNPFFSTILQMLQTGATPEVACYQAGVCKDKIY